MGMDIFFISILFSRKKHEYVRYAGFNWTHILKIE